MSTVNQVYEFSQFVVENEKLVAEASELEFPVDTAQWPTQFDVHCNPGDHETIEDEFTVTFSAMFTDRRGGEIRCVSYLSPEAGPLVLNVLND